jgi:hypothetical protein
MSPTDISFSKAPLHEALGSVLRSVLHYQLINNAKDNRDAAERLLP